MQSGLQEDVQEYWLNFVERLEEGLSEKKPSQSKSQAIAESMDEAQSPLYPNTAINGSIVGDERDSISQSFIEKAEPSDAPPALPKSQFTNTIDENFFGERVTLTKMFKKNTEEEKVLTREINRMGFQQLYLKHNRLMDDWEDAQSSEIEDYKHKYALAQSEHVENAETVTCTNEFWMRNPPNVLFFTLNRVTYNKDLRKPVKDCKEFTFEKKIYIDHMLEDNIGRITTIRTKTR
jgi:hypothetical protein